MRLRALAALPGVIRATLHDPEFDLGAVQCDSRRVDVRTGFLALLGQQHDGHRFVDAARSAGAPVLLVSDSAVYERLAATPPQGMVGVLQVVPGRAVLADLAAELAGHPSRSLRLLGVTGTSGKSTVVHLVGQLLQALGRPNARLGTQGLRLGATVRSTARTTPEAPDIHGFLRESVEQGVGWAAMEVTSVGIAQERSRGLSFAAAAFTNLTHDHLDFHGDMDAYRDAKFRLFLDYSTAAAVVNTDDATGRLLAARLQAERPGMALLTCGLQGTPALTLTGLGPSGLAMEGTVRYLGAEVPFRCGLPGAFNRSNLLVALGLLLAAGEPIEALAPAIEQCSGPAGRFEPVALGAPFTALVDYAHKPAALEQVLLAARPLTVGRLHVVFGCGGERDRAKRPQMGALAERLADRVVLTSDNPRGEAPQAIVQAIAAGMRDAARAESIVDRRAAIHAALDAAGPGDVVVIAGKGDEAYQEAGGHTVPFDDRAVALEWARLRGYAAGG